MSVHRLGRAALFRAVAVLTAGSLAFSASATGIYSIGRDIAAATEWAKRRPASAYTQKPSPVRLGISPGRAPQTRGGVWTPEARALAFLGTYDLWAQSRPGGTSQTATREVDPDGGTSYS